MHAPFRQLPSIRIQGQIAVEANALSPLDELTRATLFAKAQRLKPKHRQPTEAIIQMRRIDIGLLQVRT
jgi:hypothetical protein